MAMANCIASSNRVHMPVPQARTAASKPDAGAGHRQQQGGGRQETCR